MKTYIKSGLIYVEFKCHGSDESDQILKDLCIRWSIPVLKFFRSVELYSSAGTIQVID